MTDDPMPEDQRLRVAARCIRVEGAWEARFGVPGIPFALTTRVGQVEDVRLVVCEIVSAVATVEPDDVAVQILLDEDPDES